MRIARTLLPCISHRTAAAAAGILPPFRMLAATAAAGATAAPPSILSDATPAALAAPPSAPFSVMIHGEPVPVTGAVGVDLARAIACVPFKEWAASMDTSLRVWSVHFTDLDFFGARVGFLKFRADVRKDGVVLPGIVFMRGGAVAILPVLTCGGERFVVCCRQPRVAIGAAAYLEIPAGMMDGDGNFTGVAAKEMREETGLDIGEHELIDLTAAAARLGAAGDAGSGGLGEVRAAAPADEAGPADAAHAARGIYPSVGACDEFLRLLYVSRSCTQSELQALRGRVTGNLEEGEVITLEIVPLERLWMCCTDAKTLAALYLLQMLEARGVL